MKEEGLRTVGKALYTLSWTEKLNPTYGNIFDFTKKDYPIFNRLNTSHYSD